MGTENLAFLAEIIMMTR